MDPSRIRPTQALGDSAAEPRYVRTVHRFGYWFIGSIRGETSAAPVVRSPVKYWLIWETRQVPLSARAAHQ